MLKPTYKADFIASDMNIQDKRDKPKNGRETEFSEFLPYIQTPVEKQSPQSIKEKSENRHLGRDEDLRIQNNKGSHNRGRDTSRQAVESSRVEPSKERPSKMESGNEKQLRNSEKTDAKQVNKESKQDVNHKVEAESELVKSTVKVAEKPIKTEQEKELNLKNKTGQGVQQKVQQNTHLNEMPTSVTASDLKALIESQQNGGKVSRGDSLSNKISSIIRDFSGKQTVKPDLLPYSDKALKEELKIDPALLKPKESLIKENNLSLQNKQEQSVPGPLNESKLNRETKADKLNRLLQNGKEFSDQGRNIDHKQSIKLNSIRNESAAMQLQKTNEDVLLSSKTKVKADPVLTVSKVDVSDNEGFNVEKSLHANKESQLNSLKNSPLIQSDKMSSVQKDVRTRADHIQKGKIPESAVNESAAAVRNESETKTVLENKHANTVLQNTENIDQKLNNSSFSQQEKQQNHEPSWGRKTSGFQAGSADSSSSVSAVKENISFNRHFNGFVKGAAAVPRSEVTEKILKVVQQYNQSGQSQTLFKVDGGKFGKLDISFTKSEESTNIVILVADENAKQQMNRLLPELKANFEEQGLKFSSIETALNENSESQNQQQLNHNGLPKLSESEREELLDFKDTTSTGSRKYGYNTMEIIA